MITFKKQHFIYLERLLVIFYTFVFTFFIFELIGFSFAQEIASDIMVRLFFLLLDGGWLWPFALLYYFGPFIAFGMGINFYRRKYLFTHLALLLIFLFNLVMLGFFVTGLGRL